MKNKAIALFAAAAISIGLARPSYADGVLGGVASFFGAVTATVIDVPEGILIDSLWRMPIKTSQSLAGKFGDEKGFQQNVVGALIGVPTGFVWGIPEGAIRGGKHGLGSGWENPYSTDSFVVSESK